MESAQRFCLFTVVQGLWLPKTCTSHLTLTPAPGGRLYQTSPVRKRKVRAFETQMKGFWSTYMCLFNQTRFHKTQLFYKIVTLVWKTDFQSLCATTETIFGTLFKAVGPPGCRHTAPPPNLLTTCSPSAWACRGPAVGLPRAGRGPANLHLSPFPAGFRVLKETLGLHFSTAMT